MLKRLDGGHKQNNVCFEKTFDGMDDSAKSKLITCLPKKLYIAIWTIIIRKIEFKKILMNLLINVIYIWQISQKFPYEPVNAIIMDKTVLRIDIVGKTNIEKKYEGNQFKNYRSQVHVNICLSAQVNRKKWKPFIIFSGVKHEVKGLNVNTQLGSNYFR